MSHTCLPSFFPTIYFMDTIRTYSTNIFRQHFIIDCLTPKEVKYKAKEMSLCHYSKTTLSAIPFSCSYVCVYTQVYIYIYVHICVFICIYVYNMYTCTYTGKMNRR